MGTRLRNKFQQYKGTKTPLGGRNKLTLNVINTMQNYYGLAIRRNTNNLYAMRKAVFAIFFHFTEKVDTDFPIVGASTGQRIKIINHQTQFPVGLNL